VDLTLRHFWCLMQNDFWGHCSGGGGNVSCSRKYGTYIRTSVNVISY
jgi:hypothetical protein